MDGSEPPREEGGRRARRRQQRESAFKATGSGSPAAAAEPHVPPPPPAPPEPQPAVDRPVPPPAPPPQPSQPQFSPPSSEPVRLPSEARPAAPNRQPGAAGSVLGVLKIAVLGIAYSGLRLCSWLLSWVLRCVTGSSRELPPATLAARPRVVHRVSSWVTTVSVLARHNQVAAGASSLLYRVGFVFPYACEMLFPHPAPPAGAPTS